MAKIQDQLWNHEWQAYGVDEVVGQLANLQVEVPIIINALGGTLEEILDLFQQLERTGPAMLELPIDPGFPEHPAKLIRDLKRHLNTPLIVKVGSAFHDLPGLAKKLEEAGADCICAINSIGPGLLLDPTTGRPVFGSAQGYGQMTGPAIKPIALRCVAEIAGAVDIPVIGCGGISRGQDVIDMVRCGASAVSLHTAVIFNGFEIFERILAELDSLMKSAGCSSLDEIKGTSLQYLSDEPSYEIRPAVVSDDRCTGCGICELICPYRAVNSPDPKAVRRIDKNSCQGCGLCVSACPVQAISLA
jgi:dihydroorotate dehydrogenase/NAD-dependent dihydropyrimidine dehydrogenase PreA subunit